LFYNLKDKIGQAKGRALREINRIDISDVTEIVSSIKTKALDTKDDVLNRIDEATNQFQTEVNEYVKRPVKIKAAKYTYPLSDELRNWIGPENLGREFKTAGFDKAELEIKILEDGNNMKVTHIPLEGDMIIQGVEGEFYACKPDIFEKTYKRVQ